MTIKKPPMGWNTWNTFGPDINEKLFLETADLIASLGLRDAGYEYVVIDDCWSLSDRDENGRLVADPAKFPHGMKYVADYVHSKGLKFGMYSCCGTLTCAGYPGSYDYEYIDAETFAEWGVDYLKYDYCCHTGTLKGEYLYRRMGTALANCGRDILFSACSWGFDETHEWVKTTGAHMWRSTMDIQNSWESIKSITHQQTRLLPYISHGCFNDMDMLIVGMNRSHIDDTFGTNGCSLHDHKTHFAIWCMYASPLMIGCDIRNMSEEAKAILTNRGAIAINQDNACNQLYRIQLDRGPEDAVVVARLLENGDFAIGVFNLMDTEYRFWFGFDELGITSHCGKKLVMDEVFGLTDAKIYSDTCTVTVEGHGCRLYRCRLEDK